MLLIFPDEDTSGKTQFAENVVKVITSAYIHTLSRFHAFCKHNCCGKFRAGEEAVGVLYTVPCFQIEKEKNAWDVPG